MELKKRSRLPWPWMMAIVAAVLLLFLVLVAYLDGFFTNLSNWRFWQDFLDGPVLTIYILAVYPFVWRLWWQSVRSLQALLPIEEGDLNKVAEEVPLPNRRWEWVAFFAGVVFWLSIWQPWGRSWGISVPWLNAYDAVTQTILFGLLGWLLYSSFVGNRYISRLSRKPLNLDIFDVEPLTPIARSSLAFSLVFIGGISLSMIFQTQEDLLLWKNIVVWAILICFTILIFFLSMWSTHTAMTRAKKLELQLAQDNLKVVSSKLKKLMAGSYTNEITNLSPTITVLLSYERRVKEAPEWPFNAGIIRRLAASTLAPIAVYMIKILSGLGIRF